MIEFPYRRFDSRNYMRLLSEAAKQRFNPIAPTLRFPIVRPLGRDLVVALSSRFPSGATG